MLARQVRHIRQAQGLSASDDGVLAAATRVFHHSQLDPASSHIDQAAFVAASAHDRHPHEPGGDSDDAVRYSRAHDGIRR
jgi:hypothetical protein